MFEWHQCLDNFLTQCGFIRLEFKDVNIYVKREFINGLAILTIYVDDCIIVNNQITLIKN
jgi:hypothetical protein